MHMLPKCSKQEVNAFHLFLLSFSICHHRKNKSYSRLQSCISRNTWRRCNVRFCCVFLCVPPPGGSAVQRGRGVKSMSLVPSQDKVLLALNPSALIKTRLTNTQKTGTSNNTHTQTHTRTHTHSQKSCFDDNNLNTHSDSTNLRGPAHGARCQSTIDHVTGGGGCSTVLAFNRLFIFVHF